MTSKSNGRISHHCDFFLNRHHVATYLSVPSVAAWKLTSSPDIYKTVLCFSANHFFDLNTSKAINISTMTSTTARSSSALTGQDRAAIADAIAERQAAMPIGGLFIVLYIRGDPPKEGDFHWAFYVHTSATAGVKYHATGSPNTWMASHGSSSNVLKEFLLCVLIQVGQIPPSELDKVDRVMKTHDGELNTIPGLTCRVWVWTIMKLLLESGMVQMSGSIEQLELECKTFGNQFREGASRNEQPRPVVRSNISR